MSDRGHRRLRVLLCYGGRSAEHDVSCVSAAAVGAGLDPARYEVVPVAITRDGRWLASHDAAAALAAAGATAPAALPVSGDDLGPFDGRDGASRHLRLPEVDVVFPVLHGPHGEDGTVQGLCDVLDLPCVGAGVLGSAVAMDKGVTKRLLHQAGLPVPRWRELRDGDDVGAFTDAVAAELGFPCFVKPANLGSSVGVTKAHDPVSLRAAIDVALGHDEWVLAEEAITGREIEVAVLGDRDPVASLPGEIVPTAEFYTYDDKYVSGAAELRVPAPLPPPAVEAVQDLACRVVRVCRADGMARVDFFYEEVGRGFLVNEVNTIPGFTPISMYPKLWEASGLAYPALLDRLIELARDRHARRRITT